MIGKLYNELKFREVIGDRPKTDVLIDLIKQQKPSTEEELEVLAGMYFSEGNYKKAFEVIETSDFNNFSFKTFHYSLGSLLEMNEPETAFEKLKFFKSEEPDNLWVDFYFSNLNAMTNPNYAVSINHFQDLKNLLYKSNVERSNIAKSHFNNPSVRSLNNFIESIILQDHIIEELTHVGSRFLDMNSLNKLYADKSSLNKLYNSLLMFKARSN